MSDLSRLVMPMSYSVKNALDNIELNNIAPNLEGWKSSSNNSENTVVVQISLDAPRSFNRLSIEVLDVPQKFSVFYRDIKRNRFIKIKTFKGSVEGTVDGSRLGLEGADNWKNFQFSFPPINTDLIEIRINRLINRLPSLNFPKTTRYQVGVRNTQIRFHRVNSDISSINSGDEYNVKYFAPNSVLSDDQSFWKSPPLGPNSLFPFYVDLRDEQGRAQVVEFMKLIPLYTDSHVNIYYSNDESQGQFGLSNNKKTFNLIDGSSDLDSYWTEGRGVSVQSSNYWQLSNQDIKLNLNSSFTIGFTYEPTDLVGNNKQHNFWNLSSADATQNLSCNLITNNEEGTLAVKLNGVDQISISDIQLNSNISYGIIVSYNSKRAEWILCVSPMDTAVESEDSIIVSNYDSLNGFYPKFFNFGGGSEVEQTSLGYARNIWIRQDEFQSNYVNSFLKNTDTFIRGLGVIGHRNHGYYNAVLIAPLTNNLDALVGPDSFFYNSKVWTPANRSFVLNSSFYNLGRIKAKYLKLEFAKPTPQYYNPATSENVVLPILDFPDWVKAWFSNTQFDDSFENTFVDQFLFEGRRRPRNVSNTFGLNSFKTAIESSDQNIIFNHDQIGSDFFLSETSDEESLRNQILRNAITPQFPTVARHNYQVYDHVMTTKRAFFYGIVELSFFKQDQSLEKDNRIYYGDFLEDDLTANDWVDGSTAQTFGFTVEDGIAMSSVQFGDRITSRSLKSFSNFSSVQIAYLDSPYEDLAFSSESEQAIFASSQINFVNTDHVVQVSAEGSSPVMVVNNLKGTTDGKTILLQRTSEGFYSIESSEITMASAKTKLVAGCRVRSGVNNPNSNYEFRLLSSIDDEWKIVAKKRLNLPSNLEWIEEDLIYNTNLEDTTFKLEIIHLDSFSDETLYVDMMGLWRARNYWELSNDGGSSWVPVINNANDSMGVVSFENPGNDLKLRITSTQASSWLSQWIIIPIYDSTPVGMSTSRLFGVYDEDNPEYRDLLDLKLFSPYSTQIPKNYSIISDVVNAKKRI